MFSYQLRIIYSFCQATTNYFSKYYHFITPVHYKYKYCYAEILHSNWQTSLIKIILWYNLCFLLILLIGFNINVYFSSYQKFCHIRKVLPVSKNIENKYGIISKHMYTKGI